MVLVGATDAAPSWPPRNHLQSAGDSASVVACWRMGRRSKRCVGLLSHNLGLEVCEAIQGDSPVPVCWFEGGSRTQRLRRSFE